MFRHDPRLRAHGAGGFGADHRCGDGGRGHDPRGCSGNAGHHTRAAVGLRCGAALRARRGKTPRHDRLRLRTAAHAITIPAPHIALRQGRRAGASGDEASRCRGGQRDGFAGHHGHGARRGFAHDFGGSAPRRGWRDTAHHFLRRGPGHGGFRLRLGRRRFGDAGRGPLGRGGVDLGLRRLNLCLCHFHAICGLEPADLLARAAHAGHPRHIAVNARADEHTSRAVDILLALVRGRRKLCRLAAAVLRLGLRSADAQGCDDHRHGNTSGKCHLMPPHYLVERCISARPE